MKDGRYKYHYVEVPLYLSGLHVIVANNLTEAYQQAGFGKSIIQGQEPNNWAALAWEADRGKDYAVFCLFRPDADADTVAHEAMHATNFIMKRAGIRPDPDNDEPQAHLIGWIVGQIVQALQSKKVKAKKSIKLK